MNLYLTYNDQPEGIYSSQVIDVVKFLNEHIKSETRLVAYISLRGFKANRKKIKDQLPSAIVMPMFPGVERWRYNLPTLKWIRIKLRADLIIGRSVIATCMALKSGANKVVYDGRGAISAEWHEYNVVESQSLKNQIEALESTAINKSHFRIAVTQTLVQHWKEKFSYSGNNHVVIPCTLNKVYENLNVDAVSIQESRKKLNISNTQVVYVYSGSIAGWQSFSLLQQFISQLLKQNKENVLLLLADRTKEVNELEKEFPNQVKAFKCKPNEVPGFLLAGDYGLLVREKSITNKVASPVKFAEYLACGLKVIVSDELGDYTRFVGDYHCGHLNNDFQKGNLISLAEKQKIRTIAIEHFSKKSYASQYQKILS